MRDLSPEVAFIGRSNAGKSTLINAVCQKKGLARTSKTPGRTRHAVVYEVLLKDDDEKSANFVDLPGFGFALMSKTEAQACEDLIFSYLEKRRKLKLVVLLLDIRRSLDEREQEIVAIAHKRQLSLLLILTKCDKIPLAKRKPVINKIADTLMLNKKSILLHSTDDPAYAEELRQKIFGALD
jgi:GTP-binding protein